ncbi:hypothetical protein [Streptomyces sp. NBC_01727]|uniref:hypothetical protein n=1 Tax=Streptomyces sp. NBC_01727 TaxID=2975924 RepID=UPI002E0DE291|nr:hypothetical protein OIE76_07710 [Streptomyces sp. NBC_01727]
MAGAESYHVKVHDNGGRAGPIFTMRQLPSVGLCFDIDGRRWQVQRVTLKIENSGDSSNGMCDAVQVAR